MLFDLLSSTSCFNIYIKTWYMAHYMMQSGYITSVENVQVVIFRYIALALVIILGCVGPMYNLWFQSSQPQTHNRVGEPD